MKTLGDGNFAVVKLARLKSTDQEFAIKIIDKSKMKVNFSSSGSSCSNFSFRNNFYFKQGKENMIDNEINIMKSCNHPNIVKLHEEFETKTEVYLVTDLVKVTDDFMCLFQRRIHRSMLCLYVFRVVIYSMPLRKVLNSTNVIQPAW